MEWAAGQGSREPPGAGVTQAEACPLALAPRGLYSRSPDQWLGQSRLYSPFSSPQATADLGVTVGRGGWGHLVPDISDLCGLRGDRHQHGLQSGKASRRQWYWRWILKDD